MNVSERGMGIRSGPAKAGWESSDFPILCDICLGENPYIRMTKSEFARECKVCKRPFTVFRWKPGQTSKYKKTEICGTCAKLKNVCQTCLFDLDFGLPVELRDKFVDAQEVVSMPQDPTNRDFWANKLNANIDKLELPYKNAEVQEALKEVASNFYTSYKRNLPHICTFYVRGECNRGKMCPYRHEDISPEELEHLSKGGSIDDKIRERYHGINDPIAKRILDKVKEVNVPDPPTDLNISTLFIGGVIPSIDEDDLRQVLEKYGKIKYLKMIHKSEVAFVCFHQRQAAEDALGSLYDRFFIQNKRLKILWAKSQLEMGAANKKKGKKKEEEEPAPKQKKQEVEVEEEEEEKQPVVVEQPKKLLQNNEQLKKLMFNYDEEEGGDEAVKIYPSMLDNSNC